MPIKATVILTDGKSLHLPNTFDEPADVWPVVQRFAVPRALDVWFQDKAVKRTDRHGALHARRGWKARQIIRAMDGGKSAGQTVGLVLTYPEDTDTSDVDTQAAESIAQLAKYCAEFVVPSHSTQHVRVSKVEEAQSQFAEHLEAIGYNGPTSDGQCASLLIFAACESGKGHHETDTALLLFDVNDSGDIEEQAL